jgi:bacterioferritin-associated ferredoxin
VKRILCLCHDVTDADIARAVRLGYSHPETVKRFTSALMGPCQGRSCAELVLDAIAREAGRERSDLRIPTARPPAFPVRMGLLAGGDPVDGHSAAVDEIARGREAER